MNKKERSFSENTLPQRRRTPSFSSSLLDAIYRSIDESNGAEEVVLGGQYRETAMTKKQSNSVSLVKRDMFLEHEKEVSSLGRAVMIESWMEKQTSRGSTHYNSTSCSSDSSSAGRVGVFSSSEPESSGKEYSRRSSSCTPQRTKPVSEKKQQKPTPEGGFSKTKLRALKIYCELKKVKQPISPGGRIASFLNSIFSPGSGKKVKMCSAGATEDDVRFERKTKSACTSVSSFSRSCLSKTPPPRGKPGNNGSAKRSVRFYPVSVIVDEDSRPCGHKCIYEDDPGLMPMPQKFVRSKSKRDEVAKGSNYLRSYHQKKNISQFDFRGFHDYVEADDSDTDDDDDAGSCSSSDLFELDHLIGIGRLREELPVYETTNLKTNQAIANGFIL